MCLAGCPQTWCKEEVLHVDNDEMQVIGEVVAIGVIRYPSNDYWDAQVNTVEFLSNPLLRCERDDHPAEQQSTEPTNENPVLSWRYARPKDEKDVDASDHDWVTPVERMGESKQRAKKRAAGSNIQDLDLEVKRLRASNARFIICAENLKRLVDEHSTRISRLEEYKKGDESDRLFHSVMLRLRHKLALKMQAPLRQTASTLLAVDECDLTGTAKPSADSIDGILRGTIRARAECDLLEFEELARTIRARSLPSPALCFDPEFEQTQAPALSSTSFRIAFASFADLCKK